MNKYRRNHLQQNTPAELAIHNAVQEVEKAGADQKLTEAVILLGKAKDLVGDYVDGTPEESAKPKELSYGEKIVRSEFNPSNVGNVNFFKDQTAQILNVINQNRELDPRLAELATAAYEQACMLAVKLATSKN